ncbi:hypothetical protein [Bacillus sp. N1-1]|jgi:hypothetical protein|uniref:hypothetical protein n=1 Tax=Bacillus sp. N1-1 TaxID=2682541 RepID=UPI0013176B0C|nr:hypothetical protein [Bacillus sp. N1-1]QHA91203.1 hypothetical protein GNK04_07095 [Bacillus sp. N1-1]
MSKKKSDQVSTEDAIILMFLSLVEDDGIEVPVTLNVSGVIVSGLLIGASTYYEEITEAVKQSADDTLSKIIGKKFTVLKEGYLKQVEESKEDEETPASFIHLKDITFPGVEVDNRPNWWRGRISSVDAISFDPTHLG